jgi:alkylmercury lyase
MMPQITADSVIEAWMLDRDRMIESEPDAVHFSMYQANQLLKLLAKGSPVSAQAAAEHLDLPVAQVEAVFGRIQRQGGEVDDEGNLVGLALTLNPTPHRFRVNGKDLYAWCSLDALFLAGLLGAVAEVESTCPVTGQEIMLTVTPQGVAGYSPISTVLTIAIPGVTFRINDSNSDGKPNTGPLTDGCNQMQFFATPKAAEIWIENNPGVVVFSVEDAFRLARVNWIERRNEMQAASTSMDGDGFCCC